MVDNNNNNQPFYDQSPSNQGQQPFNEQQPNSAQPQQPYTQQQTYDQQPYTGQPGSQPYNTQYQQQTYTGQPGSQPYAQQPYTQPVYQQQPERKNGFVLNIVGLILSIIQLCIPGLICSIIGFVQAGKAKKELPEQPIPGDNTKASWVVGLIGIIIGAICLVLQVVVVVLLGAVIVTGVNSANNSGSSDIITNTINELENDKAAVDLQTIGRSDIGYVNIPESWVVCTSSDNSSDPDDAVGYGDPESGNDGYFDTYSDYIELTGWYESSAEFADEQYEYLKGESHVANVSKTSGQYNGVSATVLSFTYVGENQVAREYIYEYSSDECTVVYVEAPKSKIDSIAAYAESFSIQKPSKA